MGKPRVYFFGDDPAALAEAVKKSLSLTEVIEALGSTPTSTAYRRVREAIAAHDISTEHFYGRSYNRIKNVRSAVDLCSDPLARSTALRIALIRDGLKEAKCEQCNRKTWNSQPIPLELDHIDGNRNNNLLENLRILCCNCHAQTPTWRGRGKKGKSYAARNGTVASRYQMLKALAQVPVAQQEEASDLKPEQ